MVEGHELVHVLVEHGVDELQRSGFAQWLRVLVEADGQAVLAHDGLEERVIGGDFRFEEGDACTASGLVACHGSGDARKQFGGGFACEGQAQNLLGTDALVDEGDDAAGHGVGFAGAGARHHDHVLV